MGRAQLRRKLNPALNCTIGGRAAFDVTGSFPAAIRRASQRSKISKKNRRQVPGMAFAPNKGENRSAAKKIAGNGILKNTKTPDFKPKSRTKVKFSNLVIAH